METAQTVASGFEQSSLSKDFDPNTCDEVLGKYQGVEEEHAKKHNLLVMSLVCMKRSEASFTGKQGLRRFVSEPLSFVN